MQNQKKVQSAVEYLKEKAPFRPKTAVVLGSGLGGEAQESDIACSLAYADIPGFSPSTVKGHGDFLHFMDSESRTTAVLSGRSHLYEGLSPEEIARPVRTLALLGANRLVITNAAGALNPLFNIPSLMLITDHINFTGCNPLSGPNRDEWGPRFPDMSCIYSRDLIYTAEECALKLGMAIHKGVYIGIPGPSLETPAETRAFRRLGADAIGMSTVLESIAARHMGMEILGISCLTNKNLPDCMQETSHEKILEQAKKVNQDLHTLLGAVLEALYHKDSRP
ncbi:MAG: purine-nucleoside phosphorylase [Desulfonatronovibrionaceae bacterium]